MAVAHRVAEGFRQGVVDAQGLHRSQIVVQGVGVGAVGTEGKAAVLTGGSRLRHIGRGVRAVHIRGRGQRAGDLGRVFSHARRGRRHRGRVVGAPDGDGQRARGRIAVIVCVGIGESLVHRLPRAQGRSLVAAHHKAVAAVGIEAHRAVVRLCFRRPGKVRAVRAGHGSGQHITVGRGVGLVRSCVRHTRRNAGRVVVHGKLQGGLGAVAVTVRHRQGHFVGQAVRPFRVRKGLLQRIGIGQLAAARIKSHGERAAGHVHRIRHQPASGPDRNIVDNNAAHTVGRGHAQAADSGSLLRITAADQTGLAHFQGLHHGPRAAVTRARAALLLQHLQAYAVVGRRRGGHGPRPPLGRGRRRAGDGRTAIAEAALASASFTKTVTTEIEAPKGFQALQQGERRVIKFQRIKSARVGGIQKTRRRHKIRIIKGGKKGLAGDRHAVHGKFGQMVGRQVIKAHQHHRAPVGEGKNKILPLAGNGGVLRYEIQSQTPLGRGGDLHTLSSLRAKNFYLTHDGAS